ncbi:MAG: potassium channel family protein, partial [Fibrobacter sp.]|nr:potassium channel family protein [Fibrobacter sp.]
SIWWAVATLTTVGYGDIYPVTVLGKFLSGIIAILGIGIVALPTGIISSGFMSEMAYREKRLHICPHCGKKLDCEATLKSTNGTNSFVD